LEDGPQIILRLPDPRAGGASYPEDVQLEINGNGSQTGLSVRMGSHCVGWLWRISELTKFLSGFQFDGPHPKDRGRTFPLRLSLYDIDQGPDAPPQHSGVEIYCKGDSVRVHIGHHCFGEARGPQVIEFFRRAWLRAMFQSKIEAA
jgi:hypothetical protein